MSKIVINEEFLQEIETLQTVLKNNVAGMFGGNRQSRTFGSSCEFADYRDYAPGDDITKIDWNAFARFDKLYLKLYLDERQMHTKIYVDASRSMEYGDGKKAEQALRIAATLAYLSLSEMDKVSIYVIRGSEVTEVVGGMVGKDSFINSIGRLNDVVFDGDSKISDAIALADVGYGDGMSVIISDFLTDDNYESAIDLLSDNKRDVFCVQVLSMAETNPQLKGKSHLFDSEDSSKFYRKNINKDIIDAYKRALNYVKERINSYCNARGASYVFASAEDSIGQLFFEMFTELGVLK